MVVVGVSGDCEGTILSAIMDLEQEGKDYVFPSNRTPILEVSIFHLHELSDSWGFRNAHLTISNGNVMEYRYTHYSTYYIYRDMSIQYGIYIYVIHHYIRFPPIGISFLANACSLTGQGDEEALWASRSTTGQVSRSASGVSVVTPWVFDILR